MPRPKKDNAPTSFRLASNVHQRLVEYCEETGQPKTVAVERAITMYIDDYDRKKEALREKTE